MESAVLNKAAGVRPSSGGAVPRHTEALISTGIRCHPSRRQFPVWAFFRPNPERGPAPRAK
jgi:hypothetical protein